ncbi:MAG TPA: hypothetical protein VNI77_12190 [Nitrososphaera sp.]|nr:hypothetical protein [Nitrososphaera sp.]
MSTVLNSNGNSWFEVRPFFEVVDEKYSDMHELVMKARELSMFIVRGHDCMIRFFLHAPLRIDAGIVSGIFKNAVAERMSPKTFSAPTVSYLKMKKHYALPIHRELQSRPQLLYSTIEKMGRPCFIAVTARYHDESYSISQYVEKQLYAKPSLAGEILGMFIGSGSSSNNGQSKRSTSVERQSRADMAKEKQRLRHFHCNIAIGAESIDIAKSLMKVLSFNGDGFAIAGMERDSTYRMEVGRKPLLFADHFCVLSDIELANIIALPGDPRAARFNISRKGTYTTGPSV